MSASLLKYLSEVPDFRRGQGKRYGLAELLAMLIMGMMSGCYAYRELATFLQANAEELRNQLGIQREAMPSHVTIRTILRGVDFSALCDAFCRWAKTIVELPDDSLICLDGKALASTVSDAHTRYQNFTCIVSAFAQAQGTVLSLRRYANAETSEQPTVIELIAALGLQGVTFSLDALHCQKKRYGRSLTPAMTTS